MAAHLLVLYHNPADAVAFDDYYRARHVPLAKKVPGLQRYGVSRTVASPGGGESPYHLVADLEFASMDSLQTALGSSEGNAAAADLGNFATGGVTLLTFESDDL